MIDKEQQAQNSFNFSKELVKFWDIFVESVRETCESPKANEPLIFIIFDDVDLMPDEVINLLSTIIKYLSHPNIIVLVTADEALLYDVIENSMNNKLGKYDELRTYSEVSKLPEKRLLSVENAEKMAMQLNQKLSIIREIPKLYGDKILPPSCRYYLRSFTHCREKGRFIERVRKKEFQENEKITLERYMLEEIYRYFDAIGVNRNKNFLIDREEFIRAYFVFWGETSRQLANECLILKEFITQLIDVHNTFQSGMCSKEEYFVKLEYIMRLFANSTLNAMGNIGLSSEEIDDLLEELIVYKAEKWGIYFNYSYIRETVEGRIRTENHHDIIQNVKQGIILIVLLFFLENILTIEAESMEDLAENKRSRIHGKGVLVDLFDFIVPFENSLVCKSQGRNFEEFLHFYENMIDTPEVAAKFNPIYARSVRNYFNMISVRDTDSCDDLKRYSRENPRWLKTMTKILYYSNEGLFDIGKSQILALKLVEYASQVHDPFYENKLTEIRENIITALSTIHNINKGDCVEGTCQELEFDELFQQRESWEKPIEQEIHTLEQLQKFYRNSYVINEKILENIISRDDSTEYLLLKAEEAYDKLLNLYGEFDEYSLDTDKIDDLYSRIEKQFKIHIMLDPTKSTVSREALNSLLERMSAQIAALSAEKNKEDNWIFIVSEEYDTKSAIYTEIADRIHLYLKMEKNCEAGKEIIKWSEIFSSLQKFYLISYLRDKKQSGEMRIGLESIPYKQLYEKIRDQLTSSKNEYLGQILREYVREGSRQLVAVLWDN